MVLTRYRRRTSRRWLCQNNHPMIRDEGQTNWRCVECSFINSNSNLHNVKLRVCVNKHLCLVGAECRVCNRWRDTPWLRLLDETGESTCPAGHRVTHFDESLLYTKGPKGYRSRSCRECKVGTARQSLAKVAPWDTREFCRNGVHRKIPENYRQNPDGTQNCRLCWEARVEEANARRSLRAQARRGLPANHVDWVVVERLLAPRPLGHFRRGTHQGATDGERWVAYCTWQANNPNRDPEDGVVVTDEYPNLIFRLAEWKKLGYDKRGKRRFKTVTLGDLRRMIHTEEYARGQVLNVWPSRRKAA